MVEGLHHIAIIISSKESIGFYKQLGFVVDKWINRGYDEVVYMTGFGETLEIFIDATHPKRVDRPEAFGLRHLAFKVDDINTITNLFDCEPVRGEVGARYTYTKDPDGLPIEFRE